MKKYGVLSAIILVLLSAVVSYGMVEVTLFDNTFVRGTGAPVTESSIFSAVEGTATVRVTNGDAEDSDVEKVSSSIVTLNGEVIFGPSNFSQKVDSLEATVNLNEGDNTIDVLLRSKPGGQIAIQIIQEVDLVPSDERQIEYGGGEEPLIITTKKYLGKLEIPSNSSIEKGHLLIESGVAGETSLFWDGHFKVEMNSDATTLLTVIDENGDGYLIKLFPKSVDIKDENPIIDSMSTAIALVAMQPGIITGEPNIDAIILEIIGNQPEIQFVANQIEDELIAGTFKLNGHLSIPMLTKIGSVLYKMNNLSVPDALALNFTNKTNFYLANLLNKLVPNAYAFMDNDCSDANLKCFYDLDKIDNDGVCISALLNGVGQESQFQLQNKIARWAVLGVENSGSFDWIDWVQPRNFHIPNVDDVVGDIIKLGFSGAAEFFNKIFKFSDENLLLSKLESIMDSYFGNGKSSGNYNFPDDGLFDLKVIGAHFDDFSSSQYKTEILTSFIASTVTEVVVPFAAVIIEVKSRQIKEAIGTSISEGACSQRITNFAIGLIPRIINLIEEVDSNGIIHASGNFVSDIFLEEILSEEGVLLIGCLLKNIINVNTIRATIETKILKYSASAGVAALIDAINGGVDIFNASSSTVLFLQTLFDEETKNVDSYEALIGDACDIEICDDNIDNDGDGDIDCDDSDCSGDIVCGGCPTEFYDLNDNQVPEGWTLTISNNATSGIHDGAMWAHTVDGNLTLSKDFALNENDALTFEYDGNTHYAYWNMQNGIQLEFKDGSVVRIFNQVAESPSSAFDSSTNSGIFVNNNGVRSNYSFEQPYGVYHYTVTVKNNSIAMTASGATTNTVVYEDEIIQLSEISKVAFRVGCTTTDNAWIDNLSVCAEEIDSDGEGLIAYYPFNDNANDESLNGNDGAPMNGVQFVEGKEGKAASFDGINDYIHFANGNPVFGSDAFSISVWFKIDQVPPHNGHMVCYLGRNLVGTTANEESFAITIGEFSSTLWVHVRDVYQHNSYTAFNADIALGEWHHVVSVVTNSSLTVYLDGNEKVTVPVEDDYALTSPDWDYMRIGAMTYGDGTLCLFKGLIDEVKVYNGALSEVEIQDLYNMP